MATQDADVEAGFPLADDQATATFSELMRGFIDDPRWRVACALYDDLLEHPSRNADRTAEVMTDAYLQGMAEVGSVVSMVYTRPVSRAEDGEAVNHVVTRSSVDVNDPRYAAITALILGLGKMESRTM